MIALIVAHSDNGVIGKDGKIPWHIPEDLARFRQLTLGHVVVMGRKTFEGLGKPLPGRQTIVVSATKNFDALGCTTVPNLRQALLLAGGQDIYISGGAKLYDEALPLADVLYITVVHAQAEGDTHFPSFAREDFICTEVQEVAGEIPYTNYTYRRKPHN